MLNSYELQHFFIVHCSTDVVLLNEAWRCVKFCSLDADYFKSPALVSSHTVSTSLRAAVLPYVAAHNHETILRCRIVQNVGEI